jgi:hypothetical protein
MSQLDTRERENYLQRKSVQDNFATLTPIPAPPPTRNEVARPAPRFMMPYQSVIYEPE